MTCKEICDFATNVLYGCIEDRAYDLDETHAIVVRYRTDSKHNWYDVFYDSYDEDGFLIKELLYLETSDDSKESLGKVIESVVNFHYEVKTNENK